MFIDDVRNLVEKYNDAMQQTYLAETTAYWESATKGSEEAEERLVKASLAMKVLHSDPGVFQQIQEAMLTELDEPELSRQLLLMYLAFAGNQGSKQQLESISKLEARLEGIFNNFRGKVGNRACSENELRSVLRDSNVAEERKLAWEASKQIGAEVAEPLLELVRERNRLAVDLGFDNFYAMQLVLQEQDAEALDRLMQQLADLTDTPFEQEFSAIRNECITRFGINADEFSAWHLADPFFQEAPQPAGLNLDQHLHGRDLQALCTDFFETLGLDVRPILERSDLYPRDGKCQHAFCIHMDLEGDVRVLCNLADDEYWTSTLLHELGHAVYDKYSDFEQPYLLRGPAHIFLTEAVAMLMGRLTHDPNWLISFAGAEEGRVKEQQALVEAVLRRKMVLFARWVLVMYHFEKGLYTNPEQNLGELWWSLVTRYQGVNPPKGRDTSKDWACKIHLATAPVYYHNYLLGELMASQMHEALKEQVGPKALLEGPRAGGWLADEIFQPANTMCWDELIEQATGRPLSPTDFVRQFLQKPESD